MSWRTLFSLSILFGAVAIGGYSADKGKPTATSSKQPTELTADIKLPGIVLPREGGGFVALTVDNGFFCLRFFSDRKKPEAPGAVARVFVKWNQPQKVPAAETNILLPGSDGLSLVGNKFVRSPRIFLVYATLMDAEGKSLASYVFHFKE